MLAQDRLSSLLGDIGLHRRHFSIGVRVEVVDRHHHRHAKRLHVGDMTAKVRAALLHSGHVFGTQVRLGHAAVHLHRAHSGHDHSGRRLQPGLAALDVKELFCAKVGTKASFGDNILTQLQRGLGRDDRVAAMRDVGERAAMHEGGVVFQGLHDVRLHRVFQKNGHRAIGLDVAGVDRLFLAGIGNHDVTQTLLQIFQIVRQAQDRHDFGRNCDVKPGLTREAVGNAAKVHNDIAQRAVVHVHHAAPDDTTLVDGQLIAPIDVVVDHRRQKVVGAGDGVEVAGEVQVHLFHRHNLRHTAACSATLHPEVRAKRGFADTNHGLLADAVQTVAQTHGGGGLAFARRGGVDRGDEDQLAILFAGKALDELLAHFGLVVTIGQQALGRDAQLGPDLHDVLLLRFARDLDVGFEGHFNLPGGGLSRFRRDNGQVGL